MNYNISVIIPTYNERGNISDIIDTVVKEVNPLKEIIIVDDNSPDLTGQLVEEMRKENNKIRLIRRLNRRGLPSAIWDGILNSQGEIVLWLDADFLSLPFTLARLIKDLDNHDILVASRYVLGGMDNRKEKFRVITSRLFNQLAKLILAVNTIDLTSGYIFAKKEVFNIINISGIYGEYCIRFLYQAEKKNMRIKEAPYICLSKSKTESKTFQNLFIFLGYGLLYIFTVFKLRIFGR